MLSEYSLSLGRGQGEGLFCLVLILYFFISRMQYNASVLRSRNFSELKGAGIDRNSRLIKYP